MQLNMVNINKNNINYNMDDIILLCIRENSKNKVIDINHKYDRICNLEKNLLKDCKSNSDHDNSCHIFEKIYFDCIKFKDKKDKKDKK